MNLYGNELLGKPITAIQEILRSQKEQINFPLLLEMESKGKKRSSLIKWLNAVQHGEITINEELVFKTKSGYALDEVVSALQKDIRRGNYEQACFWAIELVNSGNAYRLWKRLMVIAVEDVGLATDPPAITVVRSFRDNAAECGFDTWDGMRAGIAATLFLALSPKNRLLDVLTGYFNYLNSGKIPVLKPEMPEYARDMHTRAGRLNKPRAELIRQWYRESSIIDKPTPVIPDEERFLRAIQQADGYIPKEEVMNGQESSSVSQGITKRSDNGESAIGPEKILGGARLRDFQGLRRLGRVWCKRVQTLLERPVGRR